MLPPAAKPRLDGWRFRWDVVLLVSFIVAAMRHWTELPCHEVLGFLVVPVLAVHLALNWKWITDVLRRSARPRLREVRFNRAWDIAQMIVAVIAIGSGLLVSRHLLPAFGMTGRRHGFWEHVHSVFAWGLMVMIGIHLGVHVHWIWSKVRRLQFAMTFLLVVAAAAGLTRLKVAREDGAFSRRFRGDAIQVTIAIVPSALVAFGALLVLRRRPPRGTEAP
jgi:hypothetical protein